MSASSSDYHSFCFFSVPATTEIYTLSLHDALPISYEAPDKSGSSLTIDAAYVDSLLDKLAHNEDLSRYIL